MSVTKEDLTELSSDEKPNDVIKKGHQTAVSQNIFYEAEVLKNSLII